MLRGMRQILTFSFLMRLIEIINTIVSNLTPEIKRYELAINPRDSKHVKASRSLIDQSGILGQERIIYSQMKATFEAVK